MDSTDARDWIGANRAYEKSAASFENAVATCLRVPGLNYLVNGNGNRN